MTNFAVIIGVLACFCLASANPRPGSEADRYETNMLSIMDSLNQKESINIYGSIVSLQKIEAEEKSEDRQVETDPLMRRIDEFLRTRRLQIKFPNDGSSADYLGRALGEKNYEFEFRGLIHGASEALERMNEKCQHGYLAFQFYSDASDASDLSTNQLKVGLPLASQLVVARTKIKRILLPILLALKLKAIIVLPIIITLIGLIGIKGLGAGVLALLLSGAVALKALLTPSAPAYPARISFSKPYEVYHDHWHRSQQLLADEQPIVTQPYRAWSPEVSFDPSAAQFSPYQEIP